MDRKRNIMAKKLEKTSMIVKEPMTRLEKDVLNWMKVNVPTKKTKFLHSHVVNYFIGRKAVDLLMEDSPWSPDKAGQQGSGGGHVFHTREEIVELLDKLLRRKMFHRAKKIPVEDEKKKKAVVGGAKKKKSVKDHRSDSDGGSEERDSGSERKEPATERPHNETETEEARAPDEDTAHPEGADAGEKKKRKIRLDMHLEQMFLDCSDAYVWLYDPIPWYYWIVGSLIVAVVVCFCLFPLWPKKVRRGTHWVVFIAACFMMAVIGAAVIKYAVFCILYALSKGKMKFWLLPNLTEDVGFLGSFWPLYDYTYTGEVIEDEDSRADEDQPLHRGDESDSNESGKSFVMVEKNKDE